MRTFGRVIICLIMLAAVYGCFDTYTAGASADGNLPAAKVAELAGKNKPIGVIQRGEPNREGQEISSEREIVETVCTLIEQGKFEEAGKFIEGSDYRKQKWESVAELKTIVEQWEKLQKERQKGREVSYKEHLAAFERVKKGLPADANAESDDKDLKDINDANEIKGPTAILAAVVRVLEFADEGQKKPLISDACVVDAVASAKAEAAKLEREGKWLDAYVRYYSWLAALEPNNKEYKEYSERLIEKAEIAGSGQDSPCETSKQRFDGVKRRIFARAVDALNFNYVSKIDYSAMAQKGLRRCRLLAEVVGTLTKTEDGRQKTEDGKQNAEQKKGNPLGESFKNYVSDAKAIAKFVEQCEAMEKEAASWPEGAGKDAFIAAFEKVLEINLTSARLPEEVLIAQFSDASFGALDPYTVIVWPTSVSEFEKAMTNEFTGIGIEITRQKGQLTVSSLVPDTPAYNSDLDAGDVIEKVDGVDTKDMPLACAVKSITGPAGTKVKLTIRREGEIQSRDITITRAKIVVPTVRGWQRNEQGKWQYIVDEREKIGYVRLTGFSEKTAEDLGVALKRLEEAQIKGLILDLRYNSGGYFDSAVEVAEDFLNEGLIVITRPRFGIPTYAAAHKKGTYSDVPMVVLVNSGSASASEIVAGALADPSQRRATLVGERTHGKGMVQGITHYPGDGAQLKYTMAYYHLPSGQRVKSRDEAEKDGTKDWGVGPDVAVELRSDEIRKMFDIQRDNEILFKAGHSDEAGKLPSTSLRASKRHTLEETVETDAQLATAILVVKSKLVRQEAREAKR
jgi:carboxyl-terminal processing protease